MGCTRPGTLYALLDDSLPCHQPKPELCILQTYRLKKNKLNNPLNVCTNIILHLKEKKHFNTLLKL